MLTMFVFFFCFRPHTADQPRYVDMQVNELRNPIPAAPRPMPAPYGQNTYDELHDVMNGEDEPPRNVSPTRGRYSGYRPTTSASPNPPANRPAPVGEDMKLAPSPMNDRYWGNAPQLSTSPLNDRYQQNGPGNAGMPNGLPNGTNGNISPARSPAYDRASPGGRQNGNYPNNYPNRMNNNNYPNRQPNDNMPRETMFIRNPQQPQNANFPARNARGQIMGRNNDYPDDDRSVISIHSQADPRQVGRWLDKVFNFVYHEVDDLSDARSLRNHIKGGGKGIPGMPDVS